MDNKQILILGMHRSGTSLITQWLSRCGLSIGDELVGGNFSNIDGHFEDIDFFSFHEKVLQSNNLSETGLIDHPIHHLESVHQRQLTELINKKNSLHSQWGWKDPRTCLFLSHYRKLLSNPKYIIIIRDPESVIRSLIKRDLGFYKKKYFFKASTAKKWFWQIYFKKKTIEDFDRNYTNSYLKVWINYNKQLLEHIELVDRNDCVVLDYKTLINNGAEVFSFLTTVWQLDLNYFNFSNVFKEGRMAVYNEMPLPVTDRSLQQEAEKIERMLRAQLFTYSIKMCL